MYLYTVIAPNFGNLKRCIVGYDSFYRHIMISQQIKFGVEEIKTPMRLGNDGRRKAGRDSYTGVLRYSRGKPKRLPRLRSW